ncbi:MAG: SIS domain-containing protein [Bdellovibrionota bacterium]
MENIVKSFLSESARIKTELASNKDFIQQVAQAGQKLRDISKDGGTIYICGNGGSTCDAMHFTEELVARYKRERPGIRAMHFMDSSTLTCWSNDYSYEDVFRRQAETFCTNKDAFIGITTSGNSANVINALNIAKEKGSYTVVLTGKDGGKIKSLADASFVVPSNETDRIQEVHITIIHALCEMIES